MDFSFRGEVRTSIVPAMGSMVKYSPDDDVDVDAEDVLPDDVDAEDVLPDDVEEDEEADDVDELLLPSMEATVCWT